MSGPPTIVTADLEAELARLRAEVADLKRARNAQHSVESDNYGSPVAVLEAGRRVVGGYDLDPFSSDYWNYWTVKADRYLTVGDDALAQPWTDRLVVNPPSGKVRGTRKSIVRAAWEKLVAHWQRGEVDSAIWVGYSLEQLVVLQAAPAHPLQFWTVVPCERWDFLRQGEGNGPPIAAGSPTHGNYLTLLHSLRDQDVARAQAQRFRDEARRLGGISGALVRPL